MDARHSDLFDPQEACHDRVPGFELDHIDKRTDVHTDLRSFRPAAGLV